MSAADLELAKHLATQAIGTVGTNLFAGELPAGVINGMVLTLYPGAPPELTCGSNGINLEIGRLQFQVRNTAEATAITKAQDAAEIFAKIAGSTIEGTRYRSVTVLQTPGLLHRDESNRPVYGMNVEFEREV